MADVIPLKVVLGSVSQLAPTDQLRADGVVPRSGTVLALGDPATTTIINLGGVGTQVDVPGSMTVTTTATFNGNTIIGDAITDDLTIVAGILADLTFRANASPHSITMQPAVAGAQALQVIGGASGGAGAAGPVNVTGGAAAGAGAGGSVVITGGTSTTGLPGAATVSTPRSADATVATAGPALTLTQSGASGASVGVFAGTLGPSTLGVAAAEGSLYLRDGGALGELYLKTGAANTAWSLVSTGAGTTTLQDAYNNSAAPATIVATAAKAIVLSNAVDATNVLQVNRTFAGLGVGINVVMGATTTGFGINVAQVSGATGAGIQVLHTTGVGVTITQTSANSGNGLTVTQNIQALGTGIVSSHLNGLRAAEFSNNNGTVGAVLIRADGFGVSQALEVIADGSHVGVSIISQSSHAMIVDSMAGGSIVDFRRATVPVLSINGAGAITATPTSGRDFTVDTLGAGAISLDSVAASNFTVSGATADLTLGARGATITLNQTGNTILVGFTATSIVGALNEVRNAIAQPASRVVSATTDTAAAGDIGNVVFVTQASTCTVALNDLSGSLISGRMLLLTWQCEGAATALVIDPGASVNIDGFASNYIAPTGRSRVSLMSRDGLNWFSGTP